MINHNIEDHADALADYMPNGRLFEAKKINNSNYRQLLRGIANELFTSEGYLISLNDEYLPDQTILFLDEWESALGLPDDCFPVSTDNNDRRRNILVKLSALGVQTASDFENLGDIFGISVSVLTGEEVASFPISFPLIFFNNPSDSRFTIIIDFPLPTSGFFIYNFPIVFGESSQFILKCLFRKVAPANCQVNFRSKV